MTTTDQLLIELHKTGITTLPQTVSVQDRKILASLARQLLAGNFLTENQANLLVKIFKENKSFFNFETEETEVLLNTPAWSEKFRIIEQVRKIYAVNSQDPVLVVEFTYNKKISQILSGLSKSLQGQVVAVSRQHTMPLTEQNILKVVKSLKNYNFQIDPKIWNFYQEIAKIASADKTYFDIFDQATQKNLKKLENDIGEINKDKLMLLNDRRYAYQYQISEKNQENSLPNVIANRPTTKVYLQSDTTSLDNLISALDNLNRFPTLVIFDGHDVKNCQEKLEKLAEIVNSKKLDPVGIYFRFDNTTDLHKHFNSCISSLGFNTDLNENTKIVGISNNKLPKFLIKSKWYPKSVITFTNNFRSNKTSVYCDSVDLIVYYNERQPMGGDIHAL